MSSIILLEFTHNGHLCQHHEKYVLFVVPSTDSIVLDGHDNSRSFLRRFYLYAVTSWKALYSRLVDLASEDAVHVKVLLANFVASCSEMECLMVSQLGSCRRRGAYGVFNFREPASLFQVK